MSALEKQWVGVVVGQWGVHLTEGNVWAPFTRKKTEELTSAMKEQHTIQLVTYLPMQVGREEGCLHFTPRMHFMNYTRLKHCMGSTCWTWLRRCCTRLRHCICFTACCKHFMHQTLLITPTHVFLRLVYSSPPPAFKWGNLNVARGSFKWF